MAGLEGKMGGSGVGSAQVPFDSAQARLEELADDVVGQGRDVVLTRDGVSYVALIDARKLDYFHALEAEYAKLVLVADAIKGLEEVAAGHVLSEADLDRALAHGGQAWDSFFLSGPNASDDFLPERANHQQSKREVL